MAKLPKGLPLEPGEVVREAWVAGIPSRSGRTAKWGGTLVLTDQRLIFEPLKVPAVSHDMFMGVLGPEYRIVCPLSELDRAEAAPDSRSLLRVHSRSGETVDFLIAAGRFTPLWSRKNTVARDGACDAIRRAIGARPAER